MSSEEKDTPKRKRPRKPLDQEGRPGRYDPRNNLNDLSGKDWLRLTRSYWETEPTADDRTAFAHPAPFMVRDVEKLISLFTKQGMTVLDPFAGSGTALLAALRSGRKAVGIDLNPEYRDLTAARLAEKGLTEYRYEVGDSRDLVSKVGPIDYVVTSPPYHNILRNDGKGVRHWPEKDRNYRIGARPGSEVYTDLPNDLGNMQSFDDFISALQEVLTQVRQVLRPGKYCTIIISDFTVNKVEMCVQGELVRAMLDIGFEFCGTTVLLQPVKPLYPFGYPYAYKINHHHQNLITFRRPKNEA